MRAFGLSALILLGACAPMVRHPDSGSPSPAFRVATSDGDVVTESTWVDKVVVLQWIGPACGEVQDLVERGHLRAIERRWMDDEGVVLAYVASSGPIQGGLKAADFLPWLSEMKLRAPVLLDTTGALAKAWFVTHAPSTAVIAKGGRVAWAGPGHRLDSAGQPWVHRAVEAARLGQNPVVPVVDTLSGCPIGK